MNTKPQSQWRDVSRPAPCPVCGKPDRCRVTADGNAVMCRRSGTSETLGKGREKRDKDGAPFYLFRRGDPPATPPAHSHTEGATNSATAEERDRVYRAFLKLLPGTGVGAALDARGVPHGSPLRKRYRALPLQGRSKIARELVAQGLEPLLARTPGFYVKTGDSGSAYWTFAGAVGLVVPVTDAAGLVVGLVVRPTSPVAGRGKYFWFSSSKHGGAKCSRAIHVPKWDGPTETVRLTEGILKADVSSELGDLLTLGLPGLYARGLAKLLAKLGVKTVRLALDADASGNPDVARAVAAHLAMLSRAGFAVELERWDAKDGKGIDDLLAAGKTPEVLSGAAAADAVAGLEASAAVAAQGGRASVEVNHNEGEVVRNVVHALAAGDGTLYQRDGALVAVAQSASPRQSSCVPRIVELSAANIRTRITDAAALFRRKAAADGGETRLPVAPPPWLPHAVRDLTEWPDVRYLVGVVTSPVLRADGTVQQEPGYDPVTGLLYIPVGAFDPIPARPTRADAVAALAKLRAGVSQFPWQEPSDLAAWLAEVITVAVRHAIPGPVPGFFHTANAASSGKTALVNAASVIATGFEVPSEGYPLTGRKGEQCEDVEEVRKVATACAVAAYPMFLLDNVPTGGTFGSSVMDAILTSTVNAGRELGTSSAPRRDASTVWLWTGNNIRPRADTVRRTVAVRLFSPEERPEERRYTGLDVVEWARRRRGALFTAALTVAAAYIRAGRPAVDLKPMGSFEGWSELVRAALVWAGEVDPCSARTEYAAEDPDRESVTALVALLEAARATGAGRTAAEIANAVSDELNASRPAYEKESAWVIRAAPTSLPLVAAYRAVFPSADRPDQNALGYRLRKYKGRAVDGKRVVRVGETAHGKVALWAVEASGVRVMGSSPAGHPPQPAAGDAPDGAMPAGDDPPIPRSTSFWEEGF